MNKSITGTARYLALALALLMLALSAGCAPASGGDGTTGGDTSGEPSVNISQYALIRRQDDAFGSEIVMEARARIKSLCGSELKVRDDFIFAGVIEPFEYEILLGECDRPETEAALEGLAYTDWTVSVNGNRVVVAGKSDTGTRCALDAFIENCIGADGALTVPEGGLSGSVTYDVYSEKLVNIRFTILGDSYVQGAGLDLAQTWSGLLADKYDWKYKNYGIGGNAVCSAAGNGTPMYLRYKQMADGADIVFVVGGRNDYNQKAPIGQITDTTGDTYYGALNVLIDGLRAKYPGALILFATAWRVNNDMLAYSDATLAACQAKGVPCLDCTDPVNCGVDMTSATFRSTYSIENSISHLNARGMEKCMPYFEKFIITEYEKFLAAK